MKKIVRVFSCLLILLSSAVIAPSASGIGPEYDSGTGSGDVACGTSGFITIVNNAVTLNSDCLGTLEIPLGVTTINFGVFQWATGITSVTFPNSITSIGNQAFYGARNISTINIPNSVTSIGADTFGDMRGLTTLSIPSSVTTIGAGAFAGARALTSLTIPNSVTSIGNFAFDGANSLTTLTLGNGITSIGRGVFWNASSLTSLTIPNGVTSIGNNAFQGASSLATLTIPNSVISIGEWAFANATSLTSLTIPNSVVTIADKAFYGARGLRNLNIGIGVTSIGAYAFVQLVSLTALTIPNSVTSIGYAAFSDAQSLTRLTIPNSLLTLDAESFTWSFALTSYQYCGNNLSTSSLSAAGLGGKTKTCPPPITIPNAPSSITAKSTGKYSAVVAFSNNASDGGSPITSYTITSNPGGSSKTFYGGSATNVSHEFSNLNPSTEYTFAVTATNAIGESAAAISNSIKTMPLEVASISALSFVDDGSGTGGKILWSGKSIDSVLYTGPQNLYPGPYNYGAFTSSWNGRVRNLEPDKSYTISIFAVSADGVGETKSLTFKTSTALPALAGSVNSISTSSSSAESTSTKLTQVLKWIEENTFVPGEGANMSNLLTKFDALVTSPHRTYIKVPTSRVSTVDVMSLTPKACTAVSTSANVDAGLVTALSGDKCTISYTVTGASRAPVTLVKDFIFKKFVK
jgi:hypothetical protein